MSLTVDEHGAHLLRWRGMYFFLPHGLARLRRLRLVPSCSCSRRILDPLRNLNLNATMAWLPWSSGLVRFPLRRGAGPGPFARGIGHRHPAGHIQVVFIAWRPSHGVLGVPTPGKSRFRAFVLLPADALSASSRLLIAADPVARASWRTERARDLYTEMGGLFSPHAVDRLADPVSVAPQFHWGWREWRRLSGILTLVLAVLAIAPARRTGVGFIRGDEYRRRWHLCHPARLAHLLPPEFAARSPASSS
jgi:hypothetical protein